MPLVSVIIPIYNNLQTIERAINSVLSQTIHDLELVVVDDGSVDAGLAYVADTFGEDSRVNIIGPRINTGPSVARNVGIEASRGTWVAVLDGDDAWKAERLAHLLAAAEGADLVADNLTVFDIGVKQEVGTQFGRFDIDGLTLEGHLSVWPGARSDTGLLKPMIRSQFLRDHNLNYDPELRCGEDFLLYCAALCNGAVFRLIEHADYIYTAVHGPRSRAQSPHTRTVIDGTAMAVKLRAMAAAYASQITPLEHEMMEEKAASLEHLSEMWEMRAALMRYDIGGCLRMLNRNAYVRGRVRDALARRLLGRFGPVKSERIVAHKTRSPQHKTTT